MPTIKTTTSPKLEPVKPRQGSTRGAPLPFTQPTPKPSMGEEMPVEEKARAWDRYIALTRQLQANEREIQRRYDRRYEIQRQLELNVKTVFVGEGLLTFETCSNCGFSDCICERDQ
jgi:hypothetical protein